MRLSSSRLVPLVAASCGALVACAQVLGVGAGQQERPAEGTLDASSENIADAGPSSSGENGSDVLPASGQDASSNIAYADLGDTSQWESHVVPDMSFFCVAIAGNYAYYSPGIDSTKSTFWRYDRSKPFDSPDAWTGYSLPNAEPTLYTGLVYDGTRYLYFVPYRYSSLHPTVSKRQGPTGTVLRFDTTRGFTVNEAWARVTLGGAVGWGTAGTDGQYLYLVPYYAGGVLSRVPIGDEAAFGDLTRWESFDLRAAGLLGKSAALNGFVFDGSRILLAPVSAPGGDTASVLGFSVGGRLDDKARWTVTQVGSKTSPASRYQSGAFDGRASYLSPFRDDKVASGRAAKLRHGAGDSDFDVEYFDTAVLGAKGFAGMTFDGRHIYYVPGGAQAAGASDDIVKTVLARVDTSKPFDDQASWSTFDLSRIAPAATSYLGAAFDGEYVYLAPLLGAPALRFKATDRRVNTPFPQGSVY